MRKIIIIIILLVSGILVYLIAPDQAIVPESIGNQTNNSLSTNQIVDDMAVVKTIIEPISQASTRVTKKPFGIKVSPTDSPVSPEKFSGYHTGVDFETTVTEQNVDVAIYAICDGPLILKKIASGYGGVVVQSCQINEQAVSVIYGHLRLSNIIAKLDQVLKMGEEIGYLGNGYTDETSGERKHLHLAIYRGSTVNILGYVKDEAQLVNWLDPMTLLQ